MAVLRVDANLYNTTGLCHTGKGYFMCDILFEVYVVVSPACCRLSSHMVIPLELQFVQF